MMKNRLLTYSILLVLCFFNFKSFADTEAMDFKSLSPHISMESSDKPADWMQLKGTDVEVNIDGSIAEVTVRQQYQNNSDRAISGRYIFPVPKRAFVHAIQMESNEEVFTAEVKEQKTAREEFIRLKEQGKNALLLKQDSSNVFSMNLANVLPGETVNTELRYTELLVPMDMRYEFVYPVVSNPAFSDQPEAGFDIVVNISAGNPIQELMCSTHDTDIVLNSESSAKVLLKNPVKQRNNRDYVLNYRLEGQKMPSGLILSGGADEKFLLFNDYVCSPGLKDISVKFSDLKTYDLEPSSIPDLSDHRPVTFIGKWKGEADGLINVEGRKYGLRYSKTYRFVKNNSREPNGALEHLWAGKRIKHLSDLNTGNEDPVTKSKITDLGLKYNVLTMNTSFLAYNDVVRKKVVPAEEVEQPFPLAEEELEPEPVRTAKVPEPGFYILLIILTSVMAAGNVRRKSFKVFYRSTVEEIER